MAAMPIRCAALAVASRLVQCGSSPSSCDSVSLLQTRAHYERRAANLADLAERGPAPPEAAPGEDYYVVSSGGASAVAMPGDAPAFKAVDPQGVLEERESAAHDAAGLEFLSAFRPCARCGHETVVGGDGDGAYAMCEELLGNATAAYSYGIEGEDAWGADLSTRLNLTVHQFDCFDTRRPLCPHHGHCNFEFNEECVGQKLGGELAGKRFGSLREQMTARGHAEAGNLLMKMDIEGSEWGIFADPDNQDLLPRFSQIIVELHLVGKRSLPQHEAMRNLLREFAVVRMHENNCCGVFDKVPGYGIARVVELTLVRRDLVDEEQCQPEPVQVGTPNKPYLDEVQGARLPGGTTPGFSFSSH